MGIEKILIVIENAIDIARTLACASGEMLYGNKAFFSILDEMEECIVRLKDLTAEPTGLPF